MDRFKCPDIEKIISHCEHCDCELYEGDTVYDFDDTYFCSSDCLLEHLDPKMKTL